MLSSTSSSSSRASVRAPQTKKPRISASDDDERGYDASDERDLKPATRRRRRTLPASKPDSAGEDDTDEEPKLPAATERRLKYIGTLAASFDTSDLVALAADFPAHARSGVLVRGVARHCRDIARARRSDLKREARWVRRVSQQSASCLDEQVEQRAEHCAEMLATLPSSALDKVIAALPGYDGMRQGSAADVSENIAMYLDVLARNEDALLVEQETMIEEIQSRYVRPRGRSASQRARSDSEKSSKSTASKE